MSNKKRERQPAPPKTTSPERADATLPAVHALHLLTVVQRCGVTEEELLQGSGLSRERLADPAARVEVLHKLVVELPKKHGRGGQSALRFARGALAWSQSSWEDCGPAKKAETGYRREGVSSGIVGNGSGDP